jgi:hypothetical protein
MNIPELTDDFSLVLGGPLYQLWRGTRLADDWITTACEDEGPRHSEKTRWVATDLYYINVEKS